MHLLATAEGTNFVAHDALEVVRKPAGREQVRQAATECRVGGGIRIVILLRLGQRLGADERRHIRVLAMHEWHQAHLVQFRRTAVSDGDFGRALHVHTTVVGGEGVRGQTLNGTTGLDAANARAPAVLLEGAVDVHCHRVSGILPGVLGRIGAGSVFLEIKLLHRIGRRTVRQAGQRARHGQCQILGIG